MRHPSSVFSVQFQYVSITPGQMHVVTAGDPEGEPLVLLHQTPRCWDEYSAVLPLLNEYRLIVPDLLGHGGSASGESTIEAQADAVVELLDVMGAEEFHLAGHHFGGLVCYEVAAQVPSRIRSLVLSSTPYIDEDERIRRRSAPAFDDIPAQSGGEHLVTLWKRRTEYLADPEHHMQVLSRYVADVAREQAPDLGHEAVAAYASESRLGRYPGPVLCIASAKNPRAFARRSSIRDAFPQAEEAIIAEGDIATPETSPEEFAALIRSFHLRGKSDG